MVRKVATGIYFPVIFVSLLFTFYVISICIVFFISDKNAIFFVTSTEKGTEIYEIVCSNPKVKRRQ